MIKDALEWAEQTLLKANVDESALNAELLLAHVLGVDRLNLHTMQKSEIEAPKVARFRTLVKSRGKREPLQYILGAADFMGLTLHVDPSVLIPRPETETLVEKTLEAVRRTPNKSIDLLEIGTGSGNISLALASECPALRITATDISQSALETAKSNAARLGISSVRFVRSDIFGNSLPGDLYDIIVSNPPYVSADDFATLQPEIRLFEPRMATTDGSDGFRFVRRILEIVPSHLRPGGTLFVELGYGQAEKAIQYSTDSGLTNVVVYDDLSGIPRVLMANSPTMRS